MRNLTVEPLFGYGFSAFPLYSAEEMVCPSVSSIPQGGGSVKDEGRTLYALEKNNYK